MSPNFQPKPPLAQLEAILIVLYPSYTVESQTAYSTWGEAAPMLSIVRQSLLYSLAILNLMQPKKWLIKLSDLPSF